MHLRVLHGAQFENLSTNLFQQLTLFYHLMSSMLACMVMLTFVMLSGIYQFLPTSDIHRRQLIQKNKWQYTANGAEISFKLGLGI